MCVKYVPALVEVRDWLCESPFIGLSLNLELSHHFSLAVWWASRRVSGCLHLPSTRSQVGTATLDSAWVMVGTQTEGFALGTISSAWPLTVHWRPCELLVSITHPTVSVWIRVSCEEIIQNTTPMTFTKPWVTVLAMAPQWGEVDSLLPRVKVTNGDVDYSWDLLHRMQNLTCSPPPDRFKVSMNVV